MQVIMDRVEVLELKVHLSITPTLTQWALAGNTTMRDLITNPQSPGRYTLPHPWACKQATQHSPFAYPVDKLNDISVGGCESP